MSVFGIYRTGTVSVTNGSKNVTFTGAGLSANGIIPGDEFNLDGLGVRFETITDDEHAVLLLEWPGTSRTNVSYYIEKSALSRSEILTYARQVDVIVNFLNDSKAVRMLAEGETPDNGLGEDGQFALDLVLGRWFVKAAGVWTGPYRFNSFATGSTTAGRIPRFADANGTQGQTGFSEDGAGNVSGVASLGINTNNAYGKLQVNAAFSYAQGASNAAIFASAHGDPAGSGSTQPYAAVRIGSDTANVFGNALDIGAQATSPFSIWFQACNPAAVGSAFPISFNPLGGNVGVGTLSPAYTVDIVGSLNCSGALSKGSGSFLIDHPLDPLNKDLKHGFVEAPRYDLLYRGRVTLAGGQATVDIDAASRMTAGTFAALTQNAEVVSLCNRSGCARVRATEITGGTFTIFCEDVNSTDEIIWVVLAERHDPFIINNDASWTDEGGRLVPERDKPDYEGE